MTIKEGDVLIKSKPFVYVLKSKLRTERCDYCFTNGKLRRCSGCQYVFYCNKDCQKTGWSDHKMECPHLRNILPKIVPESARLIMKIILKMKILSNTTKKIITQIGLIHTGNCFVRGVRVYTSYKKGGGQEREHYSKTGFRLFKDLMSHYSDIKKDEKRIQHFTSICGVLSEMLGADNIPNPAELMGIYGRVCVNCFNILDPEMMSIGAGIYLGASILDHSCQPNAVAVFEGRTLYIRALKNIPEPVDWTKVFISYIELLNNPIDRQQELLDTYYFLCQCERCIDLSESQSMKSMLCPEPACGAPVPVDNDNDNIDKCKKSLSCPKCKANIKYDLYLQFNEVTEFTKMHLQNMKDVAYIDVCKICLSKQEGLFHPMNLLHVKTLDLAFEGSIELNQWESAVKYGTLAIPGYKKYYGLRHPLYGILLLKLGKIYLYLDDLEAAVYHLEEAEKVIKITHGREHSLYRSDLLPLWHQAKSSLRS